MNDNSRIIETHKQRLVNANIDLLNITQQCYMCFEEINRIKNRLIFSQNLVNSITKEIEDLK